MRGIKAVGLGLGLGVVLAVSATAAPVVNIFSVQAIINTPDLNSGDSVSDGTGFGLGFGAAGAHGLNVMRTDTLGGDNLGTISIEIRNETGLELQDVSVHAFVDVDLGLNPFDDHAFDLLATPGPGVPTSFEIDQAFVGDIVANLQTGNLDGLNQLPGGGDVSLALGFEVGELLMEQSVFLEISLAEFVGQNGLVQYDNGGAVVFGASSSVPVPEPTSALLFGAGALLVARRRS